MRPTVALCSLAVLLLAPGCSRVDAPAACSSNSDCTSGACVDGRCDDDDPQDTGGSDTGTGSDAAADTRGTDTSSPGDATVSDVSTPTACLTTTPDLDLGVIEAGATATADVEVVNCGSIPITIQDVTLDGADGFTLGGLSGATIEPDEIAALPVIYTGGEPGVAEATVTFTASDDLSDTTDVRVEVVSPLQDGVCLEVLPEGIEFGTLEQGDQAEQNVVVRNCGSASLAFADEFTLNGETDWFLFPVFEGELGPGERIEGTVEFIAFAPAGEKFAVFEQLVLTDGDPGRIDLTIRASGLVQR